MTDWQIAVETSMRRGSVALLEDNRTVRQIVLPGDRRTAQTLAPAIAELLASVPGGRGNIGLVSVAAGPGSFTGLRIGVTAAKTLAYALGCPVAGCDTLAAIVYRTRQVWPDANAVDAAIDAYRGQVYCRRESRSGEVLVASQAKDRDQWLASFSPRSTGPARSQEELIRSQGQAVRSEESIVASGNAWTRTETVPATVRLAPEAAWDPMAATVGAVGWAVHRRGESTDPMRLRPDYLRESAAEEKAAHRSDSTTGPMR